MKDELKTLVQPQTNEVELSTGIKVAVSQIKVKQLPEFAAAVKAIFPSGIADFDKINITDLVLNSTTEIINIVKICSGVSKQELDELQIDDLIILAGKVAEVNVDFFMKRVLPSLAKASTELEATFTKLDGLT